MHNLLQPTTYKDILYGHEVVGWMTEVSGSIPYVST